MAARRAIAERDAAIRESTESGTVLAERFGLTPCRVSRIRSDVAVAPWTPATRKERYQLDVIEGGWQAACMEPDEWADWVRHNPMGLYDRVFADKPCRDCPLGFAVEMRAIGRCNGQPSGAEGEPADHEEDDNVMEPRSAGGVRGTAQLDLAPPPCETCLHAPICVLKVALGKVKTAEVSAMPLPDGLSIAVSARVDCRFYNQVKKKRAFSPEGLATVRANAVKAREARAARAANRATS